MSGCTASRTGSLLILSWHFPFPAFVGAQDDLSIVLFRSAVEGIALGEQATDGLDAAGLRCSDHPIQRGQLVSVDGDVDRVGLDVAPLPCLIGLDWTLPTIVMSFGHMGFFDSMDTNEVLAHETALHHLARNHAGELITTRPSWRGLAFRKLVGDPFDLSRRPLMGAIGTLTIRGGESPSGVLHHRDGNKVAGGGGMAHLLPAGIFQPSSVLPAAVAEDFSPTFRR